MLLLFSFVSLLALDTKISISGIEFSLRGLRQLILSLDGLLTEIIVLAPVFVGFHCFAIALLSAVAWFDDSVRCIAECAIIIRCAIVFETGRFMLAIVT